MKILLFILLLTTLGAKGQESDTVCQQTVVQLEKHIATDDTLQSEYRRQIAELKTENATVKKQLNILSGQNEALRRSINKRSNWLEAIKLFFSGLTLYFTSKH